MNAPAGLELCRVTIVAPRRRIDLSLPSDVPLAHMLPTLLRAAGADLADAGLAHSGWVLQRLDEAPFDLAQNLGQLGVKDGEILYFRPRLAQLPELSFDDVADVIASGIRERPDRWRPATTRGFWLNGAAAALLVGAAVIALSGPPWIAPAIAAGAVALIALIGAAMLSRAFGDSGAGTMLGYVALPHAFLAGLLGPADSDMALLEAGAPHLLAACGVTTLAALIAAFAVADGLPPFLGVFFAGLFGLLGAGIAFFVDGRPPAGIASTIAVVLMAFAALVPSLSFKLARLPLPPVPANADELRNDTEVVDGRTVLTRTAAANRFATGLVACISLVSIGALLFLSTEDGWIAPTLTAMMSVSLLLRARVFGGIAQRAWLLTAGLIGLGLLEVHTALTGGQVAALAMALVPLVLITGIVIAVVLWLPDHRPTPFWGRAGDIIDLLVVITLIPLALGVLDVYTSVRGLAG
ncbi:type VII secretion integral membrane protein EccD [Thermomonospora umbrina]|uniref:Type VII secretion integral membrane protein EccD n=1 Tax=Thermomonospora umbrina TaxID=111806 RepID=A0A3D9SVH8_9ACTN|nr:type VII secretion integral membrane protein EccD [Thermomonospora umbrina]REE96584.1 type VII secretion integral membrane protein EccD [Thermomonospora umbrina]